jgi:hypothetical protein
MSSSQETASERPALTLRTSVLSEFRSADGALAIFDIAGNCTTFGMFCISLARIPGLEFADLKPPARFRGPARFRFMDQDFAISMAHLDYRITVLTRGSSAERLLNQVRALVRKPSRRYSYLTST